ncbi:MAG: transglycosylase SLT domain-containing protein [bacterium]
MLVRSLVSLVLSAGLLSGCAEIQIPDLTAYLPGGNLPPMRWDARPEAATWTARTLAIVAAHDSELAARVPADIQTFCPKYPRASIADRRAFWVGLLSATAKHESSYNPKASGGRGRYIGLMQISPRTAALADCRAKSSTALKDGTANLECAVQIMAPHVSADGAVAGKGGLGIGRDWGPFRNRADRADIAGWTSAQPYCKI